MVDRAAFQHFVWKNFVETKKNGSKVITRSRGAEITAYLSGSKSVEDAHFKFWVKSRGFNLVEYPVLGLKNVLCLNEYSCSTIVGIRATPWIAQIHV